MLTEDFWAPVAPALAGRSVVHADNAAADTIPGLADAALAVAPPRFALLAHAMGGFVAFDILRRAPERVAHVMLLSTLAAADTPAQTDRREGYARLVESGQFDQVVEERVPILLHTDRRTDAALLSVIRGMANATGPARFLQQQRAIMGRIDSRPALQAITQPTLVLWGVDDGITTRAHQDDILAGIPHATFQPIDHCGHLLTMEQPAHTGALLSDWLSRND